MQFFISHLALWPANREHAVRSLSFAEDKVNVIHGRSRTGKSSIIAIIDYCLGSSRCAIPVGVIRDNVEWFALQVRIRDRWLLVARRTPENGVGSVQCHISARAGRDAPLPKTLEFTHNLSQFKDSLNKIARVTNISLSEESHDSVNVENRPSYRDLVAFNFLPQHIVANPNILFYKSDAYKHKEKLKKVLPYALGIIDVEYLTKARELNRAQLDLRELEREEQMRFRAFASWEAEVTALWNEAVELGLAGQNDDASTVARVERLRTLNDAYRRGELVEQMRTPQYEHSNQLFREATEHEESEQRRVDDLARELRDYERLSSRAQTMSTVVNSEKARVINLDWLKRNLVRDGACVVCGSTSNHTHHVLEHLDRELESVNRLSEALLENPIVDRQVEELRICLATAQEALHAARTRRLRLEPKDAAPRDSLGRAYVLLGRLQSLLMALATLQGEDELGNRIASLRKAVSQLEDYFRNAGREKREQVVGDRLSFLIGGHASNFKLDAGVTIALDQQELTLSFSRPQQHRKEYLWEIGSGANWMAYHLATFLGLHEYLTEPAMIDGPVFSFLAIDQPSQVYFPSNTSGQNLLDGKLSQADGLRGTRDDDIASTKLIFKALARGIKRAKSRYQIIVLEHADRSIWGDVENMHEVADWKQEGEGLIPRAWLL